MAWIWKAFDSLQDYLTSLTPLSVASILPQPTQLNDHVYEVCKPAGRPSVEIVCFHGLQLDRSKEAYITTWLSEDGSELWPRWIAESFSGARVLLVSYDGVVQKIDDQGRIDMYITGENLLESLTGESVQVGRDGCPVVLVGHSIGGLVIKELLLQANKSISLHQPGNCTESAQCLLESVKAVFYYATPHHGSKFADIETDFSEGPLFKRIATMNRKAARCNEDFRKLRQKNRWGASGISESLPVTLVSIGPFLLVSSFRDRFTHCGIKFSD
jgi:triacylglycerol esterase/lipase EstA (alpha/beta hydrolase family)